MNSATEEEEEELTNAINTLPEEDVTTVPDGGWGWVVLLTSFLCNGTIFGTIISTGVLYVALIEEFDQESDVTTKAALVGSLCISMSYGMCSTASIVSDRFGIQRTGIIGGIVATIGMVSSAFVQNVLSMCLTFGIILGVGLAFVYNPSMVILGHYFRRRYGIALGIYTSGGNIFGIALSLGLPHLIKAIGLQYSILVMSLMAMLTIPCAISWKPVIIPPKDDSKDDSKGCIERYVNLSIWRNKYYIILIGAFSLYQISYGACVVHLMNYMKENFPEYDASLGVVYITGASGISQLASGKMVDLKWASPHVILRVTFMLGALCLLCIPATSNYFVMVVLILFLGVFQGNYITLSPASAVDIVGQHNASQALGFLLGILAVPSAAGPPLIGYLYDHLGSYSIPFYSLGSLAFVAMLLLFCIPRSTTST